MIEIWKRQFSEERFSMKHDQPSIFFMSQWQREPGPNLYYLIYRWLIALSFLISWIMSVVEVQHLDKSAEFRVKWLIYLTNWGFTFCTVQAIMCASVLAIWFVTRCRVTTGSEEDNKAFKIYRIYWAINTTASVFAFGITIIYWSLIYDEKKIPVEAMNVIVHAINSVLMLVDLCVVKHPIRLLHLYWPISIGVCYVFFSGIYYLSGGTSRDGNSFIYPILDWNRPGRTTLVCLGVTLFLIFLHCFCYGVYRLRKQVHRRVSSALALASASASSPEKSPELEQYVNKGFVTECYVTNPV